MLTTCSNECSFTTFLNREISAGGDICRRRSWALGPMDKNQKKLYKRAFRYSAIGLEMGLSVAISLVIGYFLDRYFGTQPWLTLIFLIIGVVAGFRSLYRLMKDIEKREP
jgi:ATP synthase protein I